MFDATITVKLVDVSVALMVSGTKGSNEVVGSPYWCVCLHSLPSTFTPPGMVGSPHFRVMATSSWGCLAALATPPSPSAAAIYVCRLCAISAN
jgi:hypothetical protein